MSKVKALLLLGLVFFSGLVFGVVGTRAVQRHMLRVAIQNPGRVWMFIEHRLDRRLRLDASQQVQLHQILEGTHGEVKDLRQEFRPRFTNILAEADGKITAILTPEQKDRYDKLKAEYPMVWQAGGRPE